jgi:hypothetical protein
MYHWETDEEDFLVLSGEALRAVENETLVETLVAAARSASSRTSPDRTFG